MSAPKKPIRAWHYYIDAEGIFWHDGSELDDPELILFFLKNLKKTPEGKLQLLCQGELCEFECADVPYVIQSIDFHGDEIQLHFQGNYSEILDPHSLKVGKENVLYCEVKNGEFSARFSRKAYNDLAKQVVINPEKKYCLKLQNKLYPIQCI